MLIGKSTGLWRVLGRAGLVVGMVAGLSGRGMSQAAGATETTQAPKPGGAITLDVVAHDGHGGVVGGLSEADLGLLENGKPQAIDSFRAVTGGDAGATPVRVILLLDSVNTNFSTVAYTRSEIDKFLRQTGAELSQPTSLVLFSDTSVETTAKATTDGKDLAKQLDATETALRTVRRSAGFYGAVERFQLSMNALERLAAEEKTRPGRKLLLWLSPGWPLLSGPGVQLTGKEEESLFRTIVGVSTALREAQMTVYNVDTLGTQDSGTLRQTYYQEFLKGVSAPKQVDAADLSLQVLSVQSGGSVLNGSNDLAAQIKRCYADAREYYEMRFTPAPAERADEYRSLAFRGERKDLKLQTRTGYYAQP